MHDILWKIKEHAKIPKKKYIGANKLETVKLLYHTHSVYSEDSDSDVLRFVLEKISFSAKECVSGTRHRHHTPTATHVCDVNVGRINSIKLCCHTR